VGEKGRAPRVDFCNRCDPRARPRPSELRSTAPAVARWCSFALDGRLSASPSCGWLRDLSVRAASREVTGQGPRSEAAWPRGAASPTTIARGESFAPTRSARTPHVARSWRSPAGDADATGSTIVDPVRARLASDAFTPPPPSSPLPRARRIGPPPAPSREGERVPLHPRCLPSSDSPRVLGFAPASTGCPQPVDSRGRRLFDPRRISIL
jgi:hypothetical protein